MNNDFEIEEIQELVLIAVGIYKRIKNLPENDVLQKLAVFLYSTVGQLSNSEDAIHLKNEARKKNVTNCLNHDKIVELVGRFLSFPLIADGTDLDLSIKNFVNKEKQKKTKIEEEKAKFDATKIRKLEKIINDLKNVTLKNPAFKEMIESAIFTFDVLKNEKKGKGLFLTKEQLEEVLEAIRHVKSLEFVKPSINDYFGIRSETEDEDDDDDKEIKQFLESDEINSNESLPNLLSKYHFVLLGKPGVGKKLFVNSFKYALVFPSMFSAIKFTDPLKVVFPVQFSAYTENQLEPFEINFSTEKSKLTDEETVSFVFHDSEFRFTVIDLPILDENTQEKFRERFEKEKIHGIFLFFQASDCRFETSLLQGFSLFPPKMAEKTKFIVTCSQICNFRPGNADAAIQQLCDSIAELDWKKNKTIYVDNEGFRLLCSTKRYPKLKTGNKKRCAQSWRETRKQIFALISKTNEENSKI